MSASEPDFFNMGLAMAHLNDEGTTPEIKVFGAQIFRCSSPTADASGHSV